MLASRLGCFIAAAGVEEPYPAMQGIIDLMCKAPTNMTLPTNPSIDLSRTRKFKLGTGAVHTRDAFDLTPGEGAYLAGTRRLWNGMAHPLRDALGLPNARINWPKGGALSRVLNAGVPCGDTAIGASAVTSTRPGSR